MGCADASEGVLLSFGGLYKEIRMAPSVVGGIAPMFEIEGCLRCDWSRLERITPSRLSERLVRLAALDLAKARASA